MSSAPRRPCTQRHRRAPRRRRDLARLYRAIVAGRRWWRALEGLIEALGAAGRYDMNAPPVANANRWVRILQRRHLIN